MPNVLTYNTVQFLHGKCKAFAITLVFLSLTFAYSQTSEKDSLLNSIERLTGKKGFKEKDTTYINLLNNLTGDYYYFNVDSVYLLSDKALKLSNSMDYTKGKSMALRGLGNYFSIKGDYNTAISLCKRALFLSKKEGLDRLSIDIINDLSIHYTYSSDYSNALKINLKGIDLAKKIDDKSMLSIFNENIANLYISQKDYEQALIFYKKIIKLNEEIGDDDFSAQTFSNLASVYNDMENFEHAMFYINRSIAVFEKEQVFDWLAFAYMTKGSIYLKQKKYQWALYWYDQSQILFQKVEDDRVRVDLINGMAEANLGLGKDAISAQLGLEGYELSKELKLLEGQMNCAKTLYKIKKKAGAYDEALVYHEIFQTLSDSISRNDNKQSLNLLKTKLDYEKQKEEIIVKNEKKLARQRNVISASIVIFLILLSTSIPLYFKNKKQKKLYAQLEVKTKHLRDRETDLNEINKTKDRLFSIIGHDLRGPIGALQSLLKLFATGEIAKEELFSFIPKLRADVDHISFTLNNLLYWGQAQLKGSKTRPKVVSVNRLVDNTINLLSELAANKSIKILNQLPEKPMAYIDEHQIDIVIRNLVSNAIKFTPENGLITIEAEKKKNEWQFLVRDTGIGMDEKTQSKIFNDSSNVTTYGTNNEKGTGLGLSLCKEMVERNKGKIWVESVPKKGSSFYFTVPKVEKKYRKAG